MVHFRTDSLHSMTETEFHWVFLSKSSVSNACMLPEVWEIQPWQTHGSLSRDELLVNTRWNCKGGNVSSTSIIIRCAYRTDLKSAYPLRTFNSGSTGLMFTQLLTTFVFCASLVATAPTLTTVKLDGATVSGKASGSVQEFLGIPFAQPPLIYFCLFEAERSNLID